MKAGFEVGFAIGMLRAAGLSFAYQPKSERVRRAAKRQLHNRLDELLQFVPS